MIALVERISPGTASPRERPSARQPRSRRPGRPKAYVFNYKAPTKPFNLNLSFAKARVERDEVISALEAIIKELRAQK